MNPWEAAGPAIAGLKVQGRRSIKNRERWFLDPRGGTLCPALQSPSLLPGRCMSGPVYEEERLGMFAGLSVAETQGWPFPAPMRPAASQALFLDASADAVLGRAENGEAHAMNPSLPAAHARPHPEAYPAGEVDNPAG